MDIEQGTTWTHRGHTKRAFCILLPEILHRQKSNNYLSRWWQAYVPSLRLRTASSYVLSKLLTVYTGSKKLDT